MAGYVNGFGASPIALDVGSAKIEPKRKNRWLVRFISGQLNYDVEANATNVSRPTRTYDEVSVHRGESIAYWAGKVVFDPITLTVDDSLDGSVGRAIEAQNAAQFDTNTLAVAKDGTQYKFTMELILVDGAGNTLETYTMYGCWLKEHKPENLDYTSSDAAKIDLTIRYDLPVKS